MKKSSFWGASALLLLWGGTILNAGNPRHIQSGFDSNWNPTTQIVAMGNKGVSVSQVNDNLDGYNTPKIILENFGDNQSWDSAKHLRCVTPKLDGSGSYNPGFSILGFGNKGVAVSTTNDSGDGMSEAKTWLNDFGYNQGWRNDKHLRYLSHIPDASSGTYTGGFSIIGFGNKGVTVSRKSATENKFETPKVWLNDFGYDQGWRNDKHLRVTGNILSLSSTGSYTNAFAIIAFGNKGVSVSKKSATEDKFETPKVWLKDFGYDQGWRNNKHLRFFLDRGLPSGEACGCGGSAGIVGFGNKGVSVSIADAEAERFEEPVVVLKNFGSDQGWKNDKHLRILQDINQDGFVDVIGFGNNGVVVSLGSQSGFESPVNVLEDLGYDQGWRNDKHLRIIQDVDGDWIPDIVGFGNNGVVVALGLGNGEFSEPEPWLNDLGYNQGWRVEPVQQKQQ